MNTRGRPQLATFYSPTPASRMPRPKEDESKEEFKSISASKDGLELEDSFLFEKWHYVEADSYKKLQVMGWDGCPYSQRVWMALMEKKVEHNWLELPVRCKPKVYCDVLEGRPKMIPLLLQNGLPIVDSLLSCQFVDEQESTEPSLMGDTPHEKFQVREMLSNVGNLDVLFFKNLLAQDEDEQEETEAKLIGGLEVLQKLLDKNGGPFLAGKKFSMVDIACISIVERIFVCSGFYRGFQMPSHLSGITKWFEACCARPAVAYTMRERTYESMCTHNYLNKDRRSYLIAVYLPYSQNNAEEFYADIHKVKPPGLKIGYPAYQAERRKHVDYMAQFGYTNLHTKKVGNE